MNNDKTFAQDGYTPKNEINEGYKPTVAAPKQDVKSGYQPINNEKTNPSNHPPTKK